MVNLEREKTEQKVSTDTNNVHIHPANTRFRRSKVEILEDDNHALLAALPEKRSSHGASQFDMIVLPGTTTTNDNDKLLELEKIRAYEKRKQSWVFTIAYTRVLTKELKPG